MNLSILASAVVAGIVSGSLYGMIAVGYLVVYKATRIFNLAQGDLVMVGVLLSYFFLVIERWPIPVAVLGVVVSVVCVSLLEERLVVRPLLKLGHSQISWFIATLAVSLIIETIAADIYGFAPPEPIPSPLLASHISLGVVTISWQYVLAFAGLVVIVVTLEWFYRNTWTGQAMRATAEDREAASLTGIDPDVISRTAFAVAGLIAATAGFIIGPIVFANPTIGLTYSLEGFLALAIGGFGSVRGAIVGALLLGLAEQLWSVYFGAQLDSLAGLVVLVLLLAVRPSGIFGGAVGRQV